MTSRSSAQAAAFTAAVEPHLVSVQRVATRLAPPGEGPDVAQDALLAAFRSWKTYDPERGEVRSWLLAVVVNECRRAQRRAALRPWPRADLPDVATDGPDAPDLHVEQAVRCLPRRQREVVTLHYYLDMSVADAAAVLAISTGTVKSTLSDARATLRRVLEPVPAGGPRA